VLWNGAGEEGRENSAGRTASNPVLQEALLLHRLLLWNGASRETHE